MRSVGALVLAAGGSSRLGEPKQLVQFRGETLVRQAARAATEAGCGHVAVVVGADLSPPIQTELGDLAVLVVRNAEWQSGLGSSIRVGLEHLLRVAADLEAVVLLACDQPFVNAEIIRALISTWEDVSKSIVASGYANTVGIPALFDRSLFGALVALPNQSGAKSLIESRLADTAVVPFERGAIDIDTPADLAQLSRAAAPS